MLFQAGYGQDDLSEIGLWGCPWHGRIEGGQLHLPNGTTKTWNQPNAGSGALVPGGGIVLNTYYENEGFTFYQKMPWVSDIVRTPEQLADDEANGRTWTNDVILSGLKPPIAVLGNNTYLHNSAISRLLYAAPDETVWGLSFAETRLVSSGTFNLNVSVRRFGLIGGGLVQYNYTLSKTAAEMGQVTPALPVVSPAYTSIFFRPIDVLPDGSKIIFEIYVVDGSTSPAHTPLGFFMLSLSGIPGSTFAMTATVLKTRDETLGTLTRSNGPDYQFKYVGAHGPLVVDTSHVGTFPSCVGYRSESYTPTDYIQDTDPGWLVPARMASGSSFYEVADRVLAMWFDEDGTPTPLLFTSRDSISYDIPLPTFVSSGVLEYREDSFPQTSSCGLSAQYKYSDAAFTWSRSCTFSRQVYAKLAFGAAEKEYTGSVALNSETGGSGTLIRAPSGAYASAAPSDDIAWSGVRTVDGVTSSITTYTTGSPWPVLTNKYSGDEAAVRLTATVSQDLLLGDITDDAGGYFSTYYRRFSNNLWALAKQQISGFSSTYSGAYVPITPKGLKTAQSWTGNIPPYGAWNPRTGEFKTGGSKINWC